MENYRQLNNTRYIISRVFSDNKTTAMLIEERVKNKNISTPTLTDDNVMKYNMNGGSIRLEEGL